MVFRQELFNCGSEFEQKRGAALRKSTQVNKQRLFGTLSGRIC